MKNWHEIDNITKIRILLEQVMHAETFLSWKDYMRKYGDAEYTVRDPFPAEQPIAYYNEIEQKWYLFSKDHWTDLQPFCPLEDIADTYKLILQLQQDKQVQFHFTTGKHNWCDIRIEKPDVWCYASEETLPETICHTIYKSLNQAY